MYSEVELPGVGTLWRSVTQADLRSDPRGEPQGGPEDRSLRRVVAADGCADIILIDGELAVAGPSTRWLLGRDGREGPVVGLRFAPGLAGAALALDAADLRDLAVPARDALPGAAVDRGIRALRLFAAPGDGRRGGASLAAEYLARGCEFRRALELDIGEGQVRWASRLRGAVRTGEAPAGLAASLDLSDRQLRRRMLQSFGYGFATLRRLSRAHRAKSLLRDGFAPALAAHEAGYADQAHLTRELRRIAGRTPGQLAGSGA